MEKGFQEKILEKYHSFQAIQDCFAISRLDAKIASLSGPAAFNENIREQMRECYKEINKITAKYPDCELPRIDYSNI